MNRDYNWEDKLIGDLLILLDRKITACTVFSEMDEIHILLDEPFVLVSFSQKCQTLVIPSLFLSFNATVNSSTAS